MIWLRYSYLAATALGAVYVISRYLWQAYRTTWYDKARGKQNWRDVKDLMLCDPLEHKRKLRRLEVWKMCRDLAVLALAFCLWWLGWDGIKALISARHVGANLNNSFALFVPVHIYKDQMQVPLFLFGFCTLAATLIGIFYQWRVKARSENRQKWINEIRDVLAELIADLPMPKDPPASRADKRKRYFPRHAKLELLLNPSEEVHRTLMALLRHAYGFNHVSIDVIPRRELRPKGLGQTDPFFECESMELKSRIIRISNVVLKREWEQVKNAR